ncbi:MAG TPA: PD-(D/E)XK nuclease family protein [Gemmatimonadales bacterium]|nr:PD-(D/E)XK nuclease family protein [Gemmatimonadales bacterium]
MILGGVLRQLGGEVFGRLQRPQDFIGALDRLLGDLAAEGTPAATLQAALESRPDRDEFERVRDGELKVIYEEYLARLEAGGRRDGRDALLDCARSIAADPSSLGAALGGRREIRLFGLQDLRGGWRTLIRTLAGSGALDRIVIYTAEELELGLGAAPRVSRLNQSAGLAGRLFQVAAVDGATPTVVPILAPDVDRELDAVAARIRTLADAGVPLHRIAVVARQARPYVDLALAALDRFGVPATARRRVSWSEVPIIRAVRALLSAASDGWTRHGVAELAEQPYFWNELDVRLINYTGYRRRLAGLKAWRQALEGIAQEAEAHEATLAAGQGDEGDERRPPLPAAARAREAAEHFAAFAERAGALDAARTLRDWLGWLQQFLHDDPWDMQRRLWRVPARRYDIARLDLAGWRGLTTLVDRWCGALDEWGGSEERLTPEMFYRQFLDLLEGDVAFWTPMQCGVQVLEGFAAAYRSFDYLFLVGLEAGRFPLPAPVSPIIDERERDELAAAGLPLDARAVWDERERELFRVLVAGARESLVVSWSQRDTGGRDVIRSAFVEALADAVGTLDPEPIACSQVVTAGARLGTADGVARAADVARIEWGRARGPLSPHAGRIESPALREYVAGLLGESRLWSPTQLESYAKCPWSYFSGRLLRLDRLEDPDPEMDAATRGSLLHDALSRLFDHLAERLPTPVLLRAADQAMAIPLAEQSLNEAFAAAAGGKWLGSPLLLEPKRLELWRILKGYVEWEIEQNEKACVAGKGAQAKHIRMGVHCHELPLGEVEFVRGDIRIRFRGFVDRVEFGADPRLPLGQFVAAVDYKTTIYSCPGAGKAAAWDDGVVLQVPLYAYALARMWPEREAVRVEYRALKNLKTAHSLELYQYDRTQGRAVPDREEQDKLETALDAVAAHVRTARSGEFPVRPAASCGCPSFCHAIEICRVPGGPRTEQW